MTIEEESYNVINNNKNPEIDEVLDCPECNASSKTCTIRTALGGPGKKNYATATCEKCGFTITVETKQNILSVIRKLWNTRVQPFS